MKEKSAKKVASLEKSPLMMAANNSSEVLPLGAEYFLKLKSLPSRDFLTQLFAPKLKAATDEEANKVIEAFAGMFSGIPDFFDFQVQIYHARDDGNFGR